MASGSLDTSAAPYLHLRLPSCIRASPRASRKITFFAPPIRNHPKSTKTSIFGEKKLQSAVAKALRNIFCFMGHRKIALGFLQNSVLVNMNHEF